MLKENEVKFYNQNGYLILKDKLDKNTLSDLKNSTKTHHNLAILKNIR